MVASNLHPKQRQVVGSSTVVDITPPSPSNDGKSRLNASVRTASTKCSSTEYSSSLGSHHANNYLTGSLFDSEGDVDEFTAIEDVFSELTTQLPQDTYEKKVPPLNTKQSDDDDDDGDHDSEVDHVGLSLGGARSICSNSSNSFIEKIRSLEINEVHFEDVMAKKSKKVMDTYLDAFIDSHDHRSARRRSIQLLSGSSVSTGGSTSGTSVPKKKETKKEIDDMFSKSMNDMETRPPVVIATNKMNKSQHHSRKQSSRRRSSQLSHSMNDLAQSNSNMMSYNPVRQNKHRRPSALSSSMNDVSTNPLPPPTQKHTKPRQNRRKTVHFSKRNSDDDDIQRTESDHSKIYVKHMPWTDHKGKGGDYCGEVNRLMQPHGRGVLKYDGGTTLEVTWVNGTPLEVDRPCAIEAKPVIESNSKSRQRRRSSAHDSQPPSNPKSLPGFNLGDTAGPNDMVYQRDKDVALASIKTLKVHDFAFILRSDGLSWTYAVFANFYAKRGKISSMRFVVDELGSTKTIEKEDWAECIRMVSTEAYKSPSCSSHDIDLVCYEGPDSPCSSEEAVKDELRLDGVREFFQTAETRRPRYIQLG